MISTYPGTKVERFFLKDGPVGFLGQIFIKLQNRKLLSLLPENYEINGWLKENTTKLENNNQQFSRYPLELLTCGAAQGIIQKYIKDGQNSVFLEVALYNMRNSTNAARIYRKLSIRTEKTWDMNADATEARVDDSRLFTYLLDLRKYSYFIRITASGKDLNSLQNAKRFAHTVSSRIEKLLAR